MLSDAILQRFGIPPPIDYQMYRDKQGGNIPPWSFLDDEDAQGLRETVVGQYPSRETSLPFACTFASDDVAVFTPEGKVVIVHLFSSPGWENGGEFPSFREWLRGTIEEAYHYLDAAVENAP